MRAVTTSQGCTYLGTDRAHFRVWAPQITQVEVHIVAPFDRVVPLTKDTHGYHEGTLDGVPVGARYFYRLDGEKERPDPASRYQPQGVHQASAVVDLPPFEIGSWRGIPLDEMVLYELHVGTFSKEGTFEGAIQHLDALKALGVNTVELMPIAQCPGARNWGYDGVYQYAPMYAYGGPEGLRKLVTACHERGLAVALDVVYNHFGPEGNYLWDYSRDYFTNAYHTPWGAAVNLDGRNSDPVRRFLIDNALYWIDYFGIDAFRLDAVQELYDNTAVHFLQELAETVQQRARRENRSIHVIAESLMNNPRLIDSVERGGYGLSGQWADDYHHSIHSLLTGETTGYYADYGDVQHVVRSLRGAYLLTGQYSRLWERGHGAPAHHIPAERFVVFLQNHDQVGNRVLSDRLGATLDVSLLKVGAALTLLSPYIPLIFMGEEYADPAPFPYFVDHGDPHLIEAVRKGRREEFERMAFQWEQEPLDPQAESTFEAAKLNHHLRHEGKHGELNALYTELLRLRREIPALRHLSKDALEVLGYEAQKVIFMRRWYASSDVFAVFNFSDQDAALALPLPKGIWALQVASGAFAPTVQSGDTLSIPAHSFALYVWGG